MNDKDRTSFRILLAGEGGQGVQAVGEILGLSAFNSGFQSVYIPNFGVEQRGGVSIAFVQISNEEIGSPKFAKCDINVSLCERAISRSDIYNTKDTLLIYDSALVSVVPPCKPERRVGYPATTLAKEKYDPRVFNMIILGLLIGVTGILKIEKVEETLEYRFGYIYEKLPALREMNKNALLEGYKEGEMIRSGQRVSV